MKRNFILIIQLFLINQCLLAQPELIHTIGSIGSLSGGSEAKSIPQSFNFYNGCFQLQTGLSVLNGVIGNAAFNLDCKPSANPTITTIRLYPNPMANYVRLEGTGFDSGVEEIITLSIVDAIGRLHFNQKISAIPLQRGISYNWGWLSAGNYFLRVESDKRKIIIPFIKIN